MSDPVLQPPAYGYFIEKHGPENENTKATASIAAQGAADAIDTIFEGAYMILSIVGGEVKYTYTTKLSHEVEMGIRIP